MTTQGVIMECFFVQPSSYGPKDEFLINSTTTLNERVINDPDGFDNYDGTSDLIDLMDFISFILSPFVAALLVAEEDEGVAWAETQDIRDASDEFGDVVQPEDDEDEDLDRLHHQNIATANPSCPRKKGIFTVYQLQKSPMKYLPSLRTLSCRKLRRMPRLNM